MGHYPPYLQGIIWPGLFCCWLVSTTDAESFKNPKPNTDGKSCILTIDVVGMTAQRCAVCCRHCRSCPAQFLQSLSSRMRNNKKNKNLFSWQSPGSRMRNNKQTKTSSIGNLPAAGCKPIVLTLSHTSSRILKSLIRNFCKGFEPFLVSLLHYALKQPYYVIFRW